MTIREKKSAIGATFLFVFAFYLAYSHPAFPADTSHRENPAFAVYDGTPASHPLLIEALNAGVDVYTPAGPNRIPLPYAAALAEDIVLLKYLGEKKLFRPLRIGRDGHSEMSAYVANGGRNIRVLQALIEGGVNPYRIETGRQSVTLAAAANNLEVLHFLLDRKVDPNGVPFGDNPLHKALRAGHFKAAAMLLQFHADLFEADKEGITALERIRKISSASKDPDAKALLAGAEAVASRINSGTAMTLRDAQRMLGFSDMLINSPLVASGGQSVRIGILDTGYKGLKEWLATHPEEASRTHFAHDTSGDKSPHGFVIYRLIRKMIPDAQIYIGYPFMGSHIRWLVKNEVGYATLSVGFPMWHDPNLTTLDADSRKFRRDLDKSGIYLFAATGNTRDQTHTVSAPREGSGGWLELTPGAPGDLSEFHLLNVQAGQRLALYIGGNTWEVPHGLEAELLTRRGKELIPVPGIERIRPDGFDGAGQAQKAPGALVFTGIPEQNARIALRIRTTGLRPEERPRLKIRIVHAAGATGYQANGEESAGVPSTILSPNIISVGSFGRDPQTGLALPSEFSSIAEGKDGKYPHILGPGEIIIDNEVYQGTSYATPILAAMASLRGDISTKSLMRLISTQNGWAPGVDDRLKGRWGIPSLERLVTPKHWSKELPPMNQPPEVSGFRYQRNKSGELIFSFQARKALMNGMGLLFRTTLYDKDTRKPIMQTNAKEALQKTVWVSNPDQETFNERISLFFPIGEIPPHYLGKAVLLQVSMATAQQRRHWIKLPGIPNSIKLPAAP